MPRRLIRRILIFLCVQFTLKIMAFPPVYAQSKPAAKSPSSSSSSSPQRSDGSLSLKERQLSIAAEQAFAELDFSSAYKSSMQALSLNPRNILMRRLAAASALQLKRYVDCLRLLGTLSPKEASTDDVVTIGECSAGNGTFAPSTLKFLEASRMLEDKSDAAHYWLGYSSYKEGNFLAAQKYLNSVVILPSRFEEQKRFMLDRINDVTQATQPAAAATASPSAPGSSSTPAQSGTQLKQRKKNKINLKASDKVSEKLGEEKSASENLKPVSIPRKKPENGFFSRFNGTAGAGFAAGIANAVDTQTGDQSAYDNDVEDAVQNNREPNPDLISKKNGTLFAPLVTATAEIETGFRSANYIGNNGTEYALGVLISGSYAQPKTPLYSVLGTRLHPSNSAVLPATGAGVRASSHAHFKFGPSLSLRAAFYADRLMSELERQHGLFGTEGQFTLSTENYFFSLGAHWALLHGDDLVTGGNWNGAFIDFGMTGLGIFSLKAPPGFHMFSYQVSAPIPESRTRGVFQIVATEGRYIELNLAPSVKLLSLFRAMIWYRYVTASKRSYVSSVSEKKQTEQGDFGVKYPDSQYDSSLSDVYVAFEYTPWTWGGLTAGIAASFFSTVYNLYSVPSNPNTGVSPILYAPLLDQGSRNLTAAFLQFSATF